MALTVDARVDDALKAAQERRKWTPCLHPRSSVVALEGEGGLWTRLEWPCSSRLRSGGGATVLTAAVRPAWSSPLLDRRDRRKGDRRSRAEARGCGGAEPGC